MSWRIFQSCLASPGGVTAWLILITRPSVEQTVPSSSSCCDPGRTTSANRAVSLRKKSVQAKNSSFSSIRLTNVLSGRETTGLNDQEKSPRISPDSTLRSTS